MRSTAVNLLYLEARQSSRQVQPRNRNCPLEGPNVRRAQDIKAAMKNIFKELEEIMLKKLKVQGRLGGSAG